MGLINEVRKVSGTAPMGTAPAGSPDGADASLRSAPDQARLSGSRGFDYPVPEARPQGLWSRLLGTAKSLWGRVVGVFRRSPPAPPVPAPVAQPGGSPTGQALDADTAYVLAMEAKIQQARQDQDAAARAGDDPWLMKAEVRKAAREAAERARNATVPLTDSQAEIARLLETEQQQAAFKELGTSERDRFVQLFKAVGGHWGGGDEFARKAADGLRKLLEDDTLLQQDSRGGTLLETLASHADKPLATALDGTGLDTTGQLQNIVNMIAYPDRVFQGENTNTCVVASLQTVMADDDPAELGRIATGLIWEGQVKLHKGDLLELSRAELGKDDGGRSKTSQLIQGSLREFARQFPADGPELGRGRYGTAGAYGGGRGGGGGVHGGGRYGGGGTHGGGRYASGGSYGAGRYGGGGTHGAGRYASGGSYGGGAVGDAPAGAQGPAASVPGGLTEFQAQELYERVAGKLAVPVPVRDENREKAWSGLVRALAAGFAVPAGVTGRDDKGNPILHQVTILKVEGDQVHLSDSGSGKGFKVPASKVRKDINALILPAQFADHTGWNIVTNEDNPGDADGERGRGRYGGGGTHGGGRYGSGGRTGG